MPYCLLQSTISQLVFTDSLHTLLNDTVSCAYCLCFTGVLLAAALSTIYLLSTRFHPPSTPCSTIPFHAHIVFVVVVVVVVVFVVLFLACFEHNYAFGTLTDSVSVLRIISHQQQQQQRKTRTGPTDQG
jgi:hypothetical protein